MLRSFMHAKDHANHQGHFVSGLEKLLSRRVGVDQMHKSFGDFKQFEVILDGVHEKFVDVDVQHFDDGESLEGGVEDGIDEDEQLSPDEDPDLLGGILFEAAQKMVKVEFAAHLTQIRRTCSISFSFSPCLMVLVSGTVSPIVLLRMGRIFPLCSQ